MEEEARRREIRKTFKTFDSNGDGVITRNELADLMTALNNGAAPTPDMVEAQMRRLDRDGNGRIDRGEFRKAMNDLRIDLSSSELTRVIKKFDRDGDGSVSISEFLKFVAPPYHTYVVRAYEYPAKKALTMFGVFSFGSNDSRKTKYTV